jgi:hypothetical protein
LVDADRYPRFGEALSDGVNAEHCGAIFYKDDDQVSGAYGDDAAANGG